MLDKLKRLGTDTALYGVSTIVGRFLTFLLTPFYTNVLHPAELGVVATVYAYIAFLNILYTYGMEAAFMRYVSTLEWGTRKQNFSVPFLSLACTSLVLTLALLAGETTLARWSGIPADMSLIVLYSGWILLLDGLAVVPFASLRMDRKAKLFAALKLLNISINVGCNLLFLLKCGWGVEGIFLSNVIASGATLLFLLPTIIGNLTFNWNAALYKSLLRFSLPTVPAYLATMMIQVIDRPILESLTDKATVGIYQANYRLGIFMMLIVSMFDFAWRPFFLSQAREPDAKPLFARVLTYAVLIMTGCFLFLSFFIGDLVTLPIYHGKSIIDPRYWSGLNIVPVVLLAYVFLGISNIIVAGIYIEKKTSTLPLVTFIGAGTNIVLNVLLIPRIGIMGAALATLASYAVMALVLFVRVRKVYPVPYEFVRLAKIALASAVVYALSSLIHFDEWEIVWKCGLLIGFVLLLLLMNFFRRDELAGLKKLLSRASIKPVAEDVPPSDGI